jgi:arylsulfatase A
MVSRREFLASAAAAAGTAAAKKPGSRLPNIVLFLADDFGYGDAGFLNRASKIPTPNIDRLAAEGVHFTDAHAPSAVCSPTRYGLLTGRYCWRSRLKSGVLVPFDRTLIEPGRLTLPAMLKGRGYTTAAFGKWHLGFDWKTTGGEAPQLSRDGRTNVDLSKAVGGPVERGFDYFLGMDCPNYPPYCYIENDRLRGNPAAVFPGITGPGPNPAFGAIDSRSGPMLEGWKQEDVLPELADRAARYIGEQGHNGRRGGGQKPFFLYFASTGPHTPIVPSREFQGRTKVGPYGDWVNQVDWALGRLMESVDRAGIARDTLIVFTSDNGPERFAYDRIRQFGHYSMGSLRGLKRDTWEGGHRVPWVARWPGRIRAGTSSSEVICHTDFMATLAALSGAALPADAGEDSYDVLPAILGRRAGGARPIREATVLHSAAGHFAIRQGRWMYIDYPTGDDNKEPEWFKQERGYQAHGLPAELYDLSTDPQERRNVYGENPEVARGLKELLEKYKGEGRSR